ncbi:MAG: HPr family phosphocarrier protein [Candidatus Omnitrophica bacterium]|nr:HPr family phosphocarrier protein [Candidatus Omnitrophota bacterium]
MELAKSAEEKIQTIEVNMPCHLGLHMRTAAGFIGFSKRFESHITIQCREFVTDGKSIMGLLCLGASKGETLMITVEGEDADIACREIEAYFQQEENCYDER